MKTVLNTLPHGIKSTVFLINVMLLIYQPSKAQNCDLNLSSSLKQGIENVAKDFTLTMNEDQASKLISSLEKLGEEEDHWIVSFWKSVVYTGVKTQESIDNAQGQLDVISRKLDSSPSNCVIAALYGLQSHIYWQRGALMIRERDFVSYRDFLAKSTEQLENAAKNSPDSPMLLMMSSIATMRSGQSTAQQQLMAKHGLERAEVLFKNQSGQDIDLLEGWSKTQIEGMSKFVERQLNPSDNLSNLSEFGVNKVTPGIKQFPWIELLTDKQGDGGNPKSGDGKSFQYYHDTQNEKVWFRLEQHNPINPNFPALSISFDNDSDKENGVPWYGTNKTFMVDGMVSLGVVQNKWNKVLGYNGFTNAEGIKTRNWLNGATGVVEFYTDVVGQAYYLSVDRKYFGDSKTIRLIGSVGANALWNDDIGDQEVATIEWK